MFSDTLYGILKPMSLSPARRHDWIPGVSVIVPVFNGERFIRRCIESLLASTEPRDSMEVICVDNASTDATPAILREFQPSIQVLREVKRGPAAARNAALSATFWMLPPVRFSAARRSKSRGSTVSEQREDVEHASASMPLVLPGRPVAVRKIIAFSGEACPRA